VIGVSSSKESYPDFGEFYPDPGEFYNLLPFPVIHGHRNLGRISHLLVDHATDTAEWALTTDDIGVHRALPLPLLQEDEDEVRLRIYPGNYDMDNFSVIPSPDQMTRVDLQVKVNAIGEKFRAASSSNQWASTFAAVKPLTADFEVVRMADVSNDASSISSENFGDRSEPTGPAAVRNVGEHFPGPFPESDEQPPYEHPEGSRRELVADLPKSITVDKWFGIELMVKEVAAAVSPMGLPLDIPGGATVVVALAVPASFEVRGDLTANIAVPESGDSDPILFEVCPRAVGSFPLRFSAYRGGTFLGRLEVQVSVGDRTSHSTRESLGDLQLSDVVDGEASLQIMSSDEGTFRFLFITDRERREFHSQRIEGDIRDRIESLIPQFDSYAAAASRLSQGAALERMKNEGFRLWEQLVPQIIQEAIWEYRDHISQMTIYCDREVVPWELLYMLSGDGKEAESGFLVEQFPVVRWVMNSKRTRQLTLQRPVFVVPDGSPQQAFAEIDDVARRLSVAQPSMLREREMLTQALDHPAFDCLHFACHNRFTASRGSSINFNDGDFRPVDLALNAKLRRLSSTKPLVFLNACRTVGVAPVYTTLESWAGAFLNAGAAALIGTSWSVRDATARTFATTVYEQLAGGRTLGDSVSEARRQASAELGDSTWLAYTVYGDPRAKAVAA
jgi:hypothetical protein